MGGLNSILSVATGALAAQEAALSVVSNNIANANTPGYAREVVNLSANAAGASSGVAVGDGVSVDSITSVQDQLLNVLTQQQTSAQSAASASSDILATVQTSFAGTTGNLGSALSSFFTSLSALSASPSSSADRQAVISNAQGVVQSFNTTSANLTSTQSGLDSQVSGQVTQINSIASRIAALNGEIAGQSSQASGAGALTDQRAALEQQLSALTSVAITTTAQGDTLTTGNGSPLVVGNTALPLSTAKGSNGLLQVFDSQGNNISASLTGGSLGGTLQTRDVSIPGYLTQLDTLANGFANAMNAAQSTGYDLSGNPGGALFTVPSTVAGSAAAIALRTTNGSAIAASSDGSAGSNGNVAALTAVQTSPLASGLSTTDSISALVASVGNDASQANTQSSALQTSLTQLTNQQNAVSGVSIDQESSNLILFQQGYQAAAQVISTLQLLFNTTISMMPK